MMNLIFDLDGTLLYTLEDLRTAVNFSLEKFGFPLKTIQEIQNAVGNGLKMLMYRSLPQETNEDTALKAFHIMKEYYIDHCYDKTVPYDGIVELLKRLRSDGHSICIVSNKADALVRKLSDQFFGDLIDLALGESEKNKRKPAADMVLSAMERFGANALYIGDSEVDLQTANNADIPCYCVSWGYRSSDFLRSKGANRIYDSPLLLYHAITNAFIP